MKVHELIAQLQTKPLNATVYVRTNDIETGGPILCAVESLDPARSPVYGHAVIIELES